MANVGHIKRAIAHKTHLSNRSAGTIWERIVDVFASVISVIELEINNTKATIVDAAHGVRNIGKQYYIEKALAFQQGYSLSVINDSTLEFGYSTISETAKIIKQVAISNPQNGLVSIKVASVVGDKVSSLSPQQLQDFTAYIESFVPIGIRIETYSGKPAELQCSRLYVRYNRNYSLETIKTNIRQILINSQLKLRGLSPLFVNSIEGEIQTVEGVLDAYFAGIQIVDPSQTTPISPIDGIIDVPAGYFNFSDNILNFTNTTFTAI